ncbi:DMT family transporter [Siccirubricoccus sp. G192]|uniref:DMT family transporter n=1 Tax=Siccirubricoccus sp. G192 TaxID=2849651 RepID=UPI001C2C0834|nr:DMT family transporter [Siccirubricoccus sp. G192]MBV1799068.1 DMT family transporter [Siccirubricoccus sp. G192]
MPNSPALQRPETAGFLLLLVAVLGWGSNWPPLKLLLLELPPLAARAWAGVAAALVLAVLVRAAGVPLGVPRGLWPRLWLAALLNITSWMGFATLSLLWLDAGEACIVSYTMPVWAALLAWPLLGERPTPRRLLALGCGLAGLVVVVGGGGFAAGLGKLPGIAFALGGSVLFALGTVVTKRWPLAMQPAAAVVWQVGLGMLPLLVGTLLLESPDFAALSTRGWVFLAYMAAFPLCLCYLAWFAALRRLPASVATMGTLLAPIVGVLGSALLLGEPFGLRQVAALGLTLGGVLLVVRG